jgi:hypothetical protein
MLESQRLRAQHSGHHIHPPNTLGHHLLSGGLLDPTQHVQTAPGDLEREAAVLGSTSVSELFIGLLVGNQRARI